MMGITMAMTMTDSNYDVSNGKNYKILSRGEKCKVKLGGQEVTVTTHTFTRPGGVAYIASAFIDW